MLLYRAYAAAIFSPCHPYIWSTTVLHDNLMFTEQTSNLQTEEMLTASRALACAFMYVIIEPRHFYASVNHGRFESYIVFGRSCFCG